jgi:hypothetical protein
MVGLEAQVASLSMHVFALPTDLFVAGSGESAQAIAGT